MTSLCTTWSPSSFQLRLALTCRVSPAVFVRMRVGKLDRQGRGFSFAGYSTKSGAGLERRPTGNSWINSNSSPDSFSGWSGADGGEPSVDPKRKPWLGGITGAGIAGVILIAGLSFAALSVSKRSTSRPVQEMEPLTTQQGVSLYSDDQSDGIEQDEKREGNDTKRDDGRLSKTGIDDDSSSSLDNNEATNENSQSGSDVDSTFNSGDAINNASIQEDLQNKSAIDDASVAPRRSTGTRVLLESEIGYGSYVAQNLENSDGSLVPEKLVSGAELKESLIDAKLPHFSVSDADPADLNTDHQEGVPHSSRTENPNFSFDSSSSSTVHIIAEPLPFNIPLNSPLDAVLEPNVVHKEDGETVELLSIREDLDLSKVEVTTEGNKSSSEEHNLIGDGSTKNTLLLPPFPNEQDANTYHSINESTRIFESTNPGTSFSSAGIPAPTVVSAALQVLPGKVLVPAVVDPVQGQALAALQVLKVIESEVQPGDLCTRREYARWLVSASSILSRNTVSKVYPAMYIENVTELAFDDITPEDPDFPSIQGLAEAGLISSKLSRRDMSYSEEDQGSLSFSPECPLSRQDLVTWKMALEKRQLPEADRKILHQLSGFIDIDAISPEAWPALVADLSAGENGIISLAFGYTRLFQPDKPVTKAQAAIALATGEASDTVSEELTRIEAESMAENAVAAHNALIAQVEKDVNASFEEELLLEREKSNAVEKLAEEARRELERLRAEREEDKIALMRERAAIESEMEVLSRLRREVEQKLESLMSNKVEISYEKQKFSKLREEAEIENQEIARLQHELEVERKALSMAR
ncbi:hypothetical protein U1Q18_004575 [Sarracenia purpurea var. burkii]